MKTDSARRLLAELTESQWGLVTTRQATSRGISHMQLTRFAEAGDLVRLAHGVYRDGGTPSSSLDDLRAAWLSTAPGQLAAERLAENPDDAVVSLASAANLHRIGDFRSTAITFTTPTRRQSQKQEIRYRTRDLPASDITIVEGLPTTSRERTIADLIEAREDLSTVADAYRDASLQSRLNYERLEELLSPLAQRNGFAKNDGAALLQRLDELAELDPDSVASQIVASPELLASVFDQAMRQLPLPDMGKLLATALSQSMPESTRESLELVSQVARRTARESLQQAIDSQREGQE